MANPTLYALLDRLQGQSLALALPQVGGVATNTDIIQITSANGNAVLLNVDFQGVVHNPPVNPTAPLTFDNTRLGQYQSTLPAGSSTAALFANAFSQNVSQLDIIQVINNGGNISYWLDFLGVAHGS
jgi:hypothetical protein